MPDPSALGGVRVLDLSRLLPGPLCTQMLADLGADVIKVEDPGAGDYVRWGRPGIPGADPTAASPFFLALNRNKRSIRLDLKRAEGRDVLLRLASRADVLVESFRPGVLDRLGVGHDRLLQAAPGLVICPISGYGQDGPARDRSGHDLNYLAATGVLGLCGETAGPPTQAAVQIADVGGGSLMAAVGILAALRHAERTGEGQVVDVSMAHGALSWLAGPAAEAWAGQPPRRGRMPLGGGAVCYRVYPCADGWVSLGAVEEKFFAAFCAGANCEDLIPHQFDPPGGPGESRIRAVFAARTTTEWAAFADTHDCCLEVVHDLEDVLDSPLVTERGMRVELDQPGAETPPVVLGSPLKLTRTPPDHHRRPAPALGEHTTEVLVEAGYDEQAIARLLESGAVAGRAARPMGSFL